MFPVHSKLPGVGGVSEELEERGVQLETTGAGWQCWGSCELMSSRENASAPPLTSVSVCLMVGEKDGGVI